jgi:hypothetical protein
MISAVPSVSSVHVELDGRLQSTAGRTDETTKPWRLHELFGGGDHSQIYVYYESRKRELKTKLIYENRWNERLKN